MLTELFKDKLRVLASDDLLVKAIQTLFDEAVESFKPNISEMTDNQLIGERFRGHELSKDILKKGFADLMSYKVGVSPQDKFNKEE